MLNGGTPTADPMNWEGEVPWATPVDLRPVNGGHVTETQRHLSRQGARTGSTIAPAGSVLISSRAPIGYVATTTRAMAFNQGCKALVPLPLVTHARFLQFYLMVATADLQASGSGSTFMELSSEAVGSTPVMSPPLEEQERIANFLDDRVGHIDRIIAARERQQVLADESYEAWLDTTCAELRARCGEAPLRRLQLTIEQGWSPQVDAAPALTGEPGLLKLGSVRRGEFRPDQNKAFPESVTPREEYRIRHGDLLITRANTPALVGDVAVVDEVGDCPLYLSDLIYRVKPQQADPRFISTCLRTSAARQEISVIARGTSGSMPKLRGEDLRGLSVPNAPLPDQRALGLSDKRQRLDLVARTAALTRSIDLLTEYKQSLITAAVTGQLDVTTASTRIPE
ncbi:restriction endonuclease subunit S [Kytococcus sp. Marseille-QA3725]